MKLRFLALATTLLLPIQAAQSQPNAPFQRPLLPPGIVGTDLLPADALGAFSVNSTQAKLENASVPAASPSAPTRVLRLQNFAQPTNAWDFQIVASTVADVKKDDVLLATFQMRLVESGSGYARTDFVFEDAQTYNKSASSGASASTQWRPFFVPFRAAQDQVAGSGHINFHLGFNPQIIEIADIRVVNLGPNADFKALPRTVVTYAGRDAKAPWRIAAQKRIDQLRKGDLLVHVVDGLGRPIRGAKVKIAMTRQAFRFGTAIEQPFFAGDADAAKYQRLTRELFNTVVIGNALKSGGWGAQTTEIAGETGRAKALRWAALVKRMGFNLRGHNLVWPSYNWDGIYRPLQADPPALGAAITAHISDEVSALRGQCYQWDVVNEPFANHDFQDVLGGPSVMKKWFETAHQADPQARLFINDYGITESDGENRVHIDAYEAQIKALLDAGAPLGGIGLQSHFGEVLTPPAKVFAILDRFGKFKLPLAVTEFDVNVEDEQLQADYVRDYATICFSHPAITDFLMWGFWEGDHWILPAALYRKDWTEKPAARVWRDLMLKQWRTNLSAATNARGEVAARGFLGDYLISVSRGGQTRSVKASLTRAGKIVRVVWK